MKYAVLAGRQLFSIVFIIASAGHFNAQTIASAARHGVPLPDILVPLSGMIALAGGLSVLFGYQTRFGAWLLVLFLVPVTLIMHNFWAVWDPATSQIEKAMFMKNVTMLGGALLISYFGPGPLSLDAFVEREKQLTDAKTATGGSGCCHNNAYGNREWLSPPGGRFTFATTTRRPISGPRVGRRVTRAFRSFAQRNQPRNYLGVPSGRAIPMVPPYLPRQSRCRELSGQAWPSLRTCKSVSAGPAEK